VPLTEFQREILALLARTRTPGSYLAGGAALHFAPNSLRFSDDLDFFHDSVERVAKAFAEDRALLEEEGYALDAELSQPGFIRALVRRGGQVTRIDWAHDTAWRFLPPLKDEVGGYLLHPIDLAVNKVFALAGRDEPRDYLDMLFAHEQILSLGALCWAAAGKDPGFTPLSLLELLKRRGHIRPEDLQRLRLARPFDLVAGKQIWLTALDEAEIFVRSRPASELGCLYYSSVSGRFATPRADLSLSDQSLVTHFGAPGGVLPQPAGIRLEDPDRRA
jgi:hypothetical protein